jgi:hypothetical protein
MNLPALSFRKEHIISGHVLIKGRWVVAYRYSKGWYIARLKEKGIRYHPEKRKKLELYKTHEVRNLYNKLAEDNQH